MLEGWYCRTMANEQAAQQDETTDPNENSGTDDEQVRRQAAASNVNKGAVDYKAQFRFLKRKLKYLIYENEFFQDALRSNQRRLLKVSRDRSFLLDRLLQYEKPEDTTSESDETESSDDDIVREAKKRKLEQNTPNVGATRGRKKKVIPPQPTIAADNHLNEATTPIKTEIEKQEQQQSDIDAQQGHMTAAEVERHLQSRQTVMELIPERASATVPTEMFSNEPSLDSESNDHLMDGSSPTHVAAEECVPMEYTN